MRSSYVTPAIVLRTRPFGESDKIVSLLTKDFGKITGIAKGAMRSRKRFVNSLEPFALVNLRFQDRPHSDLAFILTADLIVGYRQLAQSLESICYAAYLVEITDGLVGEREENRAVYQHLSDSLRYLEENGTSLRFLTSFELKLLRMVGYQPVLDNCRRCHRERLDAAKRQWYFSPVDGGILCDGCANLRRETLPLGAKAVEVLAALQSERNLPSAFPLSLSVISEIRAVTLRFIQFHMAREIKSAAFLQQFSSIYSGAD
ncbi:MAG: DNA repair protein RecO [Candidatus Binatia bacterium]